MEQSSSALSLSLSLRIGRGRGQSRCNESGFASKRQVRVHPAAGKTHGPAHACLVWVSGDDGCHSSMDGWMEEADAISSTTRLACSSETDDIQDPLLNRLIGRFVTAQCMTSGSKRIAVTRELEWRASSKQTTSPGIILERFTKNGSIGLNIPRTLQFAIKPRCYACQVLYPFAWLYDV